MRIHDHTRTLIERQMSNGKANTEALRVLKRRLSDVVFRALHNAAQAADAICLAQPA
jgi:hypothetical protein